MTFRVDLYPLLFVPHEVELARREISRDAEKVMGFAMSLDILPYGILRNRQAQDSSREPAQPNLQLLHISVFFAREFFTAKNAYPANIMAPLPQHGDGYFGGI